MSACCVRGQVGVTWVIGVLAIQGRVEFLVSSSMHQTRFHDEVNYKKPQTQCNLYSECGFLSLISECRAAEAMSLRCTLIPRTDPTDSRDCPSRLFRGFLLCLIP
eukprot:3318334-Rhodomonas_salina.2